MEKAGVLSKLRKNSILLILFFTCFTVFGQYQNDYTIFRDIEDTITGAVNYDIYIDTITIDGNHRFDIQTMSVSIEMYNVSDGSPFDPSIYSISITDSLSNVFRNDRVLESNNQTYINFDLSSYCPANNIIIKKHYESLNDFKYLVFLYYLRVETLPAAQVGIHIHSIINGTYN